METLTLKILEERFLSSAPGPDTVFFWSISEKAISSSRQETKFPRLKRVCLSGSSWSGRQNSIARARVERAEDIPAKATRAGLSRQVG